MEVDVMRKKSTANIKNLKEEVKKAFPIIEKVCKIYEIEFVITSGNDSFGLHGHGHGDLSKTLHDDDLAIDIRTRDLAENDKAEFCNSLSGALEDEFPNEYDVLLEWNHLHLEHDPK